MKPRVSMYAQHPRGEDPDIETSAWLELIGTLEEPVNGVSDIEFSLHAKDRIEVGSARPASMGAIISARPTLQVVVAIPRSEFSLLWTFALSGRLTHSHVMLTKPRYNKALVTNVSFSTEREK